MTITKLMRGVAGAAPVLALAAAPAQASTAASVSVCNQASPHFQRSGLVALGAPVDSPAARYVNDLSARPGVGEGLITAASHSAALTECGAGEEDWVPSDPCGGFVTY